MKVYKDNENAQIPEFATEGSSCFDLRACLEGVESIVSYNPHNKKIMLPVKRNGKGEPQIQIHPQFRCLVPTGLIFNIPKNNEMKIYARSGMALKYGLTLANGVGVVDSDYVDPSYVMLYNLTDTPIYVSHNERIAQARLEKIHTYTLEETTKRPAQKTSRDGGMGSTGIK